MEIPLTNAVAIGDNTSEQLAANRKLVELWDFNVPYPKIHEMEDVDVITHVSVEKAKKDGYWYLHEATIAFYNNKFYAAWANHKTRETGDYDELIRGSVSDDGIHWEEAHIIAEAPMIGATSFNHPLLFSHNNVLYGFFVCWREEHYPITEIFIFNDKTGQWEHQEGKKLYGFVPFCTPQKMKNGNWILGGELHWYNAAVAISNGENLLDWRIVTIPKSEDFKLLYPESSVICYGDGHLKIV